MEFAFETAEANIETPHYKDLQIDPEGQYYFLGTDEFIDVYKVNNMKYERLKRFEVSSSTFKTMNDEATTFLICYMENRQTVIHIKGIEQKRRDPPPPADGNPILDVLYLT